MEVWEGCCQRSDLNGLRTRWLTRHERQRTGPQASLPATPWFPRKMIAQHYVTASRFERAGRMPASSPSASPSRIRRQAVVKTSVSFSPLSLLERIRRRISTLLRLTVKWPDRKRAGIRGNRDARITGSRLRGLEMVPCNAVHPIGHHVGHSTDRSSLSFSSPHRFPLHGQLQTQHASRTFFRQRPFFADVQRPPV